MVPKPLNFSKLTPVVTKDGLRVTLSWMNRHGRVLSVANILGVDRSYRYSEGAITIQVYGNVHGEDTIEQNLLNSVGLPLDGDLRLIRSEAYLAADLTPIEVCGEVTGEDVSIDVVDGVIYVYFRGSRIAAVSGDGIAICGNAIQVTGIFYDIEGSNAVCQ